MDYQPFPAVAQHEGAPPLPMPEGPMMTAQPMQPIMQPQLGPVAERLPPDRLFKMYQAWEQAKEAEIQEAYLAQRYYNGRQWTDSELKALKRRKQPIVTKNRIKRKVDFLVGVEQRLRRDPKGVPRNPGGEKACFIGTASLRYVADINHWQAVASDCAHDGLVRGIGIQWAGIAKIKGKPEIRKHRVPSDRFFYDPRSERWDFSDARYLGEHMWLDLDQAKEMLPFAADILEHIATTARQGESQGVLPQEFDKEKNWHPWVNVTERRVRLISIWYKHNGQWMFDFLVGSLSLCPDPVPGDMDPIKARGMDCLSPYRDENDETIHPYEAWSPYVDERGDRYGVIRDMIPVQDEINKRSSKALHLLTVRQTAGEAGAVKDIDKMKAELAKPDGHVEYNPGKKFEVLKQNDQIQGNLELLQEAKAEIENLGPNPGLIGRGVENQSGRAILAQQNSGMTELSPVFERLREWKLRCYRKDWHLIRQFWTQERYIRVSGHPDAFEFLRLNVEHVDPQTGQRFTENAVAEIDMDIILDEGPDTVTMREELVQQLTQMGPQAVPPELLIELSNISEKDMILEKLAKFKEPPPEVMQMQKRLAELEELTKGAQLDKIRADTEAVRTGVVKTGMEAGIPPQMLPQIGQMFPFYYREPTYLDMGQNMLSGEQGGPQQPPPMPPPGPNMLGQPEGPPPDEMMMDPGMAPPPGAEDDYLAASSTPWIPGDEPILNQQGGLPLGPM